MKALEGTLPVSDIGVNGRDVLWCDCKGSMGIRGMRSFLYAGIFVIWLPGEMVASLNNVLLTSFFFFFTYLTRRVGATAQ